MKKKRSNTFKAKVALDAVKGNKTIAEIAKQCQVHPNQVSLWKQQLLDELPGIFSRKKEKKEKKIEQFQDNLYKEVGKLKVENEFLKKKYRELYGEDVKW